MHFCCYSFHAATQILDSSCHSHYHHSIAILKDIRSFVSCHPNCHITFWDCPSKSEWPPHKKVDTEFNYNPSQPVFSHAKCHRNSVTKRNATRLSINGRCTSNKGRRFLELTENEGHITEPNHSKGGTWLDYLSKSPSLCARATRMITNHAPTGEYQQRFFLKSCPCNNLTLETREHIIICYTTNPGDS